jgi:hypothetical protein
MHQRELLKALLHRLKVDRLKLRLLRLKLR